MMTLRRLAFLLTILFPLAIQSFQLPTRDNNNNNNNNMVAPAKTDLKLSLHEEDASQRLKVGILRVDGPDRKGIVAAFAQLLFGQ